MIGGRILLFVEVLESTIHGLTTMIDVFLLNQVVVLL
jgi:hypothetical protein